MKKNTELKNDLEVFLNKTSKKSPKTISVTCLQFGDTGKGKFVDIFANWADIIARGTGGDNAGHTVICNGESKVFHLIPSGITKDRDGKVNIVGTGAVVYPKTLQDEIDLLHSQNMTTDNFKLSLGAKLIMPYHILLDRLSESKAGRAKIGTTGKGIGPAYADHVARRGLIVNDMLNPAVFREKLEKAMVYVSKLMATADPEAVKAIMFHEHLEKGLYYQEPKSDLKSVLRSSLIEDNFFNVEAIVKKYLEYGKKLSQYITDTEAYLKDNLGKKKILLEGAQGALLDLDYGTYPYVTSSNCTPAGLAKGVGLKESDIDISFGIVKGFYMTRVGKGPFPTEIGGSVSEVWCNGNGTREEEDTIGHNDVNQKNSFLQGVAIRRAGGEYGATTGRPRRVGWIDIPLLRQGLNCGKSEIILTKLDVLTGLEKIKVCYAYRYEGPDYNYGKFLLKKGQILDKSIVIPEVLEECAPLYKEFPGWKEDISKFKKVSELPDNFMNILNYIFKNVDAKARIISVGPAPEETIFI